MIMYLSSKYCPDIAFAVHQCSRFTHAPCQLHDKAVKRIFHCIKGIEDRVLIIQPYKNPQVDCYIDAYFSSTWDFKEDQNPIWVKSRTGFIIILMGYPINWVSNLKYQIALITIQVEYISLSQFMRELIGIREVIRDIQTFFISRKTKNPKYFTHSKGFFLDDIPPLKAYEDN